MGTNYYKVIPLTEDIKNKMYKVIENNLVEIGDFNNVYFPEEEVNLPKNRIHIGKNSMGWKFLFDHNNWKYFGKKEQQLKDWINDKSGGVYIEDEYGDKYTPEEFWNMVEKTYEPNENGEERLDNYKYHLKYPNELYYERNSEYFLGKYRVSAYTNFS